MKNRINFIFNAHLPFVRHPEFPRFLEEDWLYEAVNESYLPLLRMMYRLRAGGVNFRLTFSLSPTLCSMLTDPLLTERLERYLESRLELGEREKIRLRHSPQERRLAEMYTEAIKANISFYREECNSDILSGFNNLQQSGHLELITTAATHAYLPLYMDYPAAVNAQVETGLLYHNKLFSKNPEGFWLPGCGFYAGLEKILAHHGVSWVPVSSQALFLADREPLYGNYAPVRCPNGLYCFARDHYLTSLVWSSTEGYPCDVNYREFYRDIGYDLPLDYIRPYIHEPDVRVFTGFKYWAVTGQTPEKQLYDPEKASSRVQAHAKNFLYNIKNRGRSVENLLDSDPVFTLSFDAELFGHWWYEGVQWLEYIIRFADSDPQTQLITPSDYISSYSAGLESKGKKAFKIQTLTPATSSWGEGGYSQIWVDNSTNAWIIPHVLKSMERMSELAKRFPDQRSLKQRFLNQAAREALLLMSSDWPFIIHNHTSEEYAKKRLTGHIQNLNLVYDNMCKNAVNTEWLVKAEKRNNIFPDIDYNMFDPEHPGKTSPLFS